MNMKKKSSANNVRRFREKDEQKKEDHLINMTKQMPTTWKDTQNILKQKIYTIDHVVNRKTFFIYLARVVFFLSPALSPIWN